MWPAPAAPFETAVTSLLAATNNGDGTYTLTFDAPITYPYAPAVHGYTNWIAFSLTDGAWHTLSAGPAASGNTLILSLAGADPGGTQIALLTDWSRIHSANPIAVPVMVETA